MAQKKIQVTKDYRLFERSSENRITNIKKHKKLVDSMKTYGFLPEFPIVVFKNGTGKWKVRDGQHRLMIAESQGLPVYWIEASQDWDVAKINCAAKGWVLRDYAEKFKANGNKHYAEGLEFADEHHLPVGTAFALLAGYTNFSNTQDAFVDGTFKIKDRSWADAVAAIYSPLVALASPVRNARFIEACMAVCRVKDFDANRLLRNVKRCREKLVAYSTRDAYLDMLEEIYNFGCHHLVGLKAAALMAMRDRSAAQPKKKAG